MLATPRPRASSRLVAAAALLLLGVGGWWVGVAPAEAATTHRVDVVGDDEGGFSPRVVTVSAGDTVRWVWVVPDRRTITFEDPTLEDGSCLRTRVTGGCEGEEHIVRFDEAGRYGYMDSFDGFTGTVVVEAAASPSPSDTAVPPRPTPTVDPTAEPSSEPEPSPTESSPSPSPSRTSTPAPSPTPAPSSSSPTPAPTPSTETAAPVAVEAESPSPTASTPDVAAESSPRPVPVPSFESFPEAQEPATGDDVDGAVAIDTGDGDGARTIWGVVGGVTVLGTLGAFGRRVLFADDWDA